MRRVARALLELVAVLLFPLAVVALAVVCGN